MMEALTEASPCPRCGRQLIEVGDDKRFLGCYCGYKFDRDLSREAVVEDKEEAEPERTLRVPFWEHEGRCYESIVQDGDPKFLSFEGEKFVLDDHLIVDGLKLKPARGAYTFTNQPSPDVGSLYAGVYRVVYDYFSHIDSRVHKFLALYVMHGYVLAKSPGTIFLWFVGRKRSGKTTIQLIMERIGYRPFAAVDPTEATVFRTLGCDVEYAPLIIVKEYERASPAMRQIAREGNIPGSTVPRVDKDTTGAFFVNSYHTYGSRVVGSNKLHGEEADMDRYCVIKCMKLKPRRPRSELLRKKEVIDGLSALRDRLLLWKVANYQSISFPYEDPTGKINDGRDWENYGGIITLAGMVSPELESEIRDFVTEHLEESAEEEKSAATSLLMEAVQDLAIPANKEGDSYRIAFRDIWEQFKKSCTESRAEDGSIVPNRLVGPNGEVISTTKAGRILKDLLMGKPVRWGSGKDTQRGYVWTDQILGALSATGSTGATGLEGQTEAFQASLTVNESGQPEAQTGPPRPIEPVTPVQPVAEAHP
jgi:hypothetical protein